MAGLDPGWAAVVAAVIALTGTVVTLVVQAGGASPTPAGTPTNSTMQAPTETRPSTPPAQAPASPSPGQPTITVVSALAPQLRAPVVAAADSLRTLSLELPLLVRDEFDNNDYGWGMGQTDYADGISCSTGMTASTLQLTVVSGRGSAYCFNGVNRNVRNFALITELGIPAQRGAEVGVLFGAPEDRTLVLVDPQSQSISLSKGATTLLALTFVDDIRTDAPNRLHLIALEKSVALFVNDKLVVLATDMPDLGSGPPALYVRLDEANQTLTMQSDRLELRGA